tara:strand:+ start:508 stop:801 length:294 start_codon:yes stop_codon:yes gene_type:complete
VLIELEIFRQLFLTLKSTQSKIDQLLRENPICKINKAKAVATKGAAGNWLFNLLIETFDHGVIFLLFFDIGSLFDFGGNPNSFLLLASPIIGYKLIF